MTLSGDLARVLQVAFVVAFPVMGVARAQQPEMKNLPTSKELGAVPGDPQRVNSLPMALAVSPDGRYVVTVNAGYGTFESRYDQSLAVMDTRTGVVSDFPDTRTAVGAKQTLFSGLAFSADGKHVYAGLASTTVPLGNNDGATGNAVAVYGFADGRITPERLMPIPLQKLAGSRRTGLRAGDADGTMAIPFPAAIAVVEPPTHRDRAAMDGASGSMAGERLLIADNLSDDALLMDAATGRVEARFDLSESDTVPGTYPVALAVSKDGRRGYVALWNASEVVELDLAKGTVGRKLALLRPDDPVKPGSHPCALRLSPDGKTLYVALANRDAVAAIDVSRGKPIHGEKTAMNGVPGTSQVSEARPGAPDSSKFEVKGYFDTRLPGQTYFGAEPDAVAVSADGSRVYAANMGSDAVAVLDPRKLTRAAVKAGFVEPDGFIPTQWMPISMVDTGGKLYVATAKGYGTTANDFAQKTLVGVKSPKPDLRFTYIATMLYGSLAAVDPATVDLKASTGEVLKSNRMKAAQERIVFAAGGDRIKHVIYAIKENRTYDQILGDLKQDGKPVGNGDASLTMYGEGITPNQHKLALQFGVLDNFFDSAEVSGDGHVWSNAAIGTDYLEKTWQQSYRGSERTYDYEGVVAHGYPLLQRIPDVAEPQSGYMWGNAEAHGKTHYNFGEYIASTFCDAKATVNPSFGPLLEGSHCAKAMIQPGEEIPAEWGGGVNKWQWSIPLVAKNVPTKPELVGHYAEESPDFNLKVPDQIRVEVFLRHFQQWVKDREAGRDTMPDYITMRLGDDHTAGTTPGDPTPQASVADNDLAVGRLVDAVSHSPYWDDTALVFVEDDAQNGADHVDAHRSTALVVSKYAPHGQDGRAVVDSHFYTTVSLIRTMEALLGLPPMNNNDALAPLIGTLFTGPGDQAPYRADYSNRDNGLIYKANTKDAVGAKESAKMDFAHEDKADPRKLNVILWKDAMGDKPVPAQILVKTKSKKDDDD